MLGFQMFMEAAKQTGCSCVPFSQMATLFKGGVTGAAEGAGGICYGLAIDWLSGRTAGKSSESILATFGPTGFDVPQASGLSPASTKSKEHWKNQSNLEASTELLVAETGLTPALKDDKQKVHTYCVSHEQYESADGGAAACVEWLGRARNTRYFMISITNFHAMAAIGSKSGLEFFDPNGGVAATNSAKKLTSFFTTWFGTSDHGAFDSYKGKGGAQHTPNRVIVTVSKYKVAGKG